MSFLEVPGRRVDTCQRPINDIQMFDFEADKRSLAMLLASLKQLYLKIFHQGSA